jgi:hypothetical protein
MARFLLGLILGAFLGALAVSYDPSLSDRARGVLASLTALVATGAEKAAQSVDRGAGKIADQAERAGHAAGNQEPPPPVSSPPR